MAERILPTDVELRNWNSLLIQLQNPEERTNASQLLAKSLSKFIGQSLELAFSASGVNADQNVHTDQLVKQIEFAANRLPNGPKRDFDFSSIDSLLRSVIGASKRVARIPDSEVLKLLASMDDHEREHGFNELRRQVSDDDLREGAVNLLLTAFQPYILKRSVAAVHQATRATFSAQDIAQVVSLKLAKRVREGRIELRNIPQFKVFLRTMTQRMATDKLRVKPGPRARVHATDEDGEALPIASSDPTASSEVSAAELEDIVRRHLQPDEWAAFRARFYDNLDWDAVAAILYPSDTHSERERRANAVRIRLGRALKKLATRLSAFEPLLAEKDLLPPTK